MPYDVKANTSEATECLREGKYLLLPASLMVAQAEGRADAARLLHELATHLQEGNWDLAKWDEWGRILDRVRQEQPDYIERLQYNLLLEFVFMVVRTAEDLSILLRAIDPDIIDPKETRKRFYASSEFPSTLKTFSQKAPNWYRRLVRLPMSNNLAPEEQQVLNRVVWSECETLRIIIGDTHRFLVDFDMMRPYLTIKHGGQTTPNYVTKTTPDLPEWTNQVAPSALAFYNWKNPVDTAVPIPLSRAALLRYEVLLNDLRLAITFLGTQYQRTVPVGRAGVMPLRVLSSSGLEERDQPIYTRLVERFNSPKLEVEMEMNPPVWKSREFRMWVQRAPALNPATQHDIDAFCAKTV